MSVILSSTLLPLRRVCLFSCCSTRHCTCFYVWGFKKTPMIECFVRLLSGVVHRKNRQDVYHTFLHLRSWAIRRLALRTKDEASVGISKSWNTFVLIKLFGLSYHHGHRVYICFPTVDIYAFQRLWRHDSRRNPRHRRLQVSGLSLLIEASKTNTKRNWTPKINQGQPRRWQVQANFELWAYFAARVPLPSHRMRVQFLFPLSVYLCRTWLPEISFPGPLRSGHVLRKLYTPGLWPEWKQTGPKPARQSKRES